MSFNALKKLTPSITRFKKITARQIYVKHIDIAWNNAFRKILNAHWYESVKPLQYQCGVCQFLLCMLPMRKLLFWKKMLCSENVVLCLLAKSCKDGISLL